MLPLFRGYIDLEVENCPHYPSTRTFDRTWPAQHSTQPRQAALLNKCQTASGASYYVFLGAELKPHDSSEFTLRLAIPEDPCFAEDLARVLPEQFPQPLPRATLTLNRGRYHPVDTRSWALRMALSQLLQILITEGDWPPASPLLDDFSQQWKSGKYG